MIFVLLAIHLCSVLCQSLYSNNWAVKIDGGIEEAKNVAARHGFQFVYEIVPGYYSFKQRTIRKRSIQSSHHHHSKLLNDEQVEWAEQQVIKKRVKRDFSQGAFNDPLWPQMWYMSNSRGNDMRVMQVYRKYNITGRGVHVTVLDDGLEKDHPDLEKNYDPGSSFDVNDNDDDPQPTYVASDDNRHGTRCAGEVAAEANNSICSVGIAYEARIGGVRMLDGDVTDVVESKSFGLNPQHIDVYSVSWGPEDDGKTVDGPGTLTRKVILDGIYKGRSRLGNIFIWASGNGGLKGDSCACDGYANLIYTLTISSASEGGRVPWYSEPCSSTIASTYSSGSAAESKIVTTDLRKRCTTDHTGTSASAPLAAGICALVLEANPQLTWRDVQYIVFLTAREANLLANDWVVNGAGRKVSHHFGFGLMDATAMVEAALDWVPVPEQRRCQVPVRNGTVEIPRNGIFRSTVSTDVCRGNEENFVQYLEHVDLTVVLRAPRRGEVEIFLTSPMGTRSQLLIRRSADTDPRNNGFVFWTFMTVHCWGEDPSGEWVLEVKNRETTSQLEEFSLTLYGVPTRPVVYDKYLSVSQTEPITKVPESSNHSHHNTRITKETGISPWAKTDMLCDEMHFIHNNTCLRECPIGYFGDREGGRCLPCAVGCVRCTSLDVCIRNAVAVEGKPQESSVTVVVIIIAISLVSVIVALIVLSLLRCAASRGGSSIGDYRHFGGSNNTSSSNNSNRLHANAFHFDALRDKHDIGRNDSIKEPLLVDGGIVLSSSEDEENKFDLTL